MKIYEVKIETLNAYYGTHEGYKVLGYYARRERAEAVRAEAEASRNAMVEGHAEIRELEVEE